MKKDEKIIHYSDKAKIDCLISILSHYKFDELKKTKHYRNSLLEKDTDENLLRKTYPEFGKIKLIGLRKKMNGNENYDVYYELEDCKTIILAIDVRKKPPVLNNGFIRNTSLKNFIKYLAKRYGENYLIR